MAAVLQVLAALALASSAVLARARHRRPASGATTTFADCIAAIGNCNAACGCYYSPASASYCACDSGCELGCSGVSAQDGSCCGCSVAAVSKCHQLHDCDGFPCGDNATCTPSTGCRVATRPTPSCEGNVLPASYVQHHRCSWSSPGTPGPAALCQPDSCGDVVNCSTCSVAPPGHRPTAAEVEAAVRPVLNHAAEHFNASFTFGWADGLSDASVGVIAGNTLNSSGGDRSLVPVGSTTKVWTAVAVLQLIERGLFSLDTRAHTLLDPVLKSQCGKHSDTVVGCIRT